MRTAFVKTLEALAADDERIWLLCGDVGFSVLEGFATRFPNRFVNMGVAEQNMIGVAAGLALSGKIVFVYSIANFPVVRCLEQIRNDVCYHNLDVKIVAVGAGLAYGAQGYTHHAVEDIGVMRLMPNMSVFAPADRVETRLVTEAAIKRSGPCYIRIGKSDEACIHTIEPDFEFGKAIILRRGRDVAILACGSAVRIALEAAETLQAQGVLAEVASMPTVQPADRSYILDTARRIRRMVTVEEHGAGGLGGILAELSAELPEGVRLARVCLAAIPLRTAGDHHSLCQRAGVSQAAVIAAIRRLLESPG